MVLDFDGVQITTQELNELMYGDMSSLGIEMLPRTISGRLRFGPLPVITEESIAIQRAFSLSPAYWGGPAMFVEREDD